MKNKKPDRKKLEKELDKLFSQAVIARDGKCKISGTTLKTLSIEDTRFAFTDKKESASTLWMKSAD